MAFFLEKVTRFALVLLPIIVIDVFPSFAQKTSSNTLERVRRTGAVTCGVSGELKGFSYKNNSGEWQGFDVDFCRAIAAAIFDDPSKILIREVPVGSGGDVLEKRQVDIVVARTSVTMSREIGEGLSIPAITYFDGQGLLVAKTLEMSSVQELAGKTICVQKATVKADNVSEFFRIRKIVVTVAGYPTGQETFAAYERGECHAVSADMSTLYAWRMSSTHFEDYTFLSEIIAKEPTGPMVHSQDRLWGEIIKWTHMAMVNAEELRINRKSVDDELVSQNLAVKRLLGLEGNLGALLGLDNAWAYRIIRHVGNYGEVFERNIGVSSALQIKRGQNALWSDGGLQFSIPIR